MYIQQMDVVPVWRRVRSVSAEDCPKKDCERDRRRTSELLERLLLEIYTSKVQYGDGYTSTTSARMDGGRFSVALLRRKDVLNLKTTLLDLEDQASRLGSVLVRQLKRRDALRRQRDSRYDVIGHILRKRVSDFSPEMRFSIEPLPGESGFSQWHSAMKMVSQLPEGIPPEFRRRLWLSLAERHLSARSIDWTKVERNCFSEWSHPADAELGVQIVKDLHRTGCSLFCGKDGQENQALLKRVLLAYARWNKAVGYCQGFNMLAALILQVTEKCESDALKLMIYLIEGVLPDSYFADSLRGLSVDMAVFRELLRTKLPKLSRHLDTLQVASKEGTTSYEPPLTNVFTMQWFLTLFCNCLPQPTVLRVWDLILLEGNEILLRTSLAIWQVLADRIMTVRSADEFYCLMGVLMREILEYDLIDANTLIKGIVQIGPLAELRNLREHYLYNITPWVPPSADSERRLKVYPKERLMLDIGVLKKQYTKLKQRQRQAHIIFNTAVARQTARPPPVAMNHLLLGKSALVPARRLGPPKGSVPPARQQVPKTIQWKDARRDSSSSTTSSSSSDTELCDDPKKAPSSSSSSTTEGEDLVDDLPDDNLPSDKTLMTDNTAEPQEAADNQIKSDIFVTETSDLYNCLERSDSAVSEDGFDFEKFLEERVRNLKDDSEDSAEDTSEMERIKYARKNSVRALEIIQENSLILHRILQTCQTRLSPTPPSSEQERVQEEKTPTNDEAIADFPPCDQEESGVDLVTEADYNLEKYRVKLGSPLMDEAKVEDLVEYSTILKFIRGEGPDSEMDTGSISGDMVVSEPTASSKYEVESTAKVMVEMNESDEVEQINKAFEVEQPWVGSKMVGAYKSVETRVEPRSPKIGVNSEMVGAYNSEVLGVEPKIRVDPEIVRMGEADELKQKGTTEEGVWMDSEMDKSNEPKIGVLMDSETADKSGKVEQIDTILKGVWMDSQMMGVDKSEELLAAVKVEELRLDSKEVGVEPKEVENINAEVRVGRVLVDTATVSEPTSIRASNSAEEVKEDTRVETRYVPYSFAGTDLYHSSNLDCSIPKIDSPPVEEVKCINTSNLNCSIPKPDSPGVEEVPSAIIVEPVLQVTSDEKVLLDAVDSGVELKRKQELMRFSLSFGEEPKEERCVEGKDHTSRFNPKKEELITIGKDSKYNSILEYSRNLDEKFNSLILQSRSSKLPLKFTYSLDDTRVSPSWTAVSKSEPPSQKSPLSPIELLSPTLSDDFQPEATSTNFYLVPENSKTPSKLSPSQTYQKSPVSPILESPGKTYPASPGYPKSPGSPILESYSTSPSYLKTSGGHLVHQETGFSLTEDSASCLNVGTDKSKSPTSPKSLENLRSPVKEWSLPTSYVASSTFEDFSSRKSPNQTQNLETNEQAYKTNLSEKFESPKKPLSFTAKDASSPGHLGSEDLDASKPSNRAFSLETDQWTYQSKFLSSSGLDNPEDICYQSNYLPSPGEDLIISRSPNDTSETDETKPFILTSPERLYCLRPPTKPLAPESGQSKTLTLISPEDLYNLRSPKKTTAVEEPPFSSYLTYSGLNDIGSKQTPSAYKSSAPTSLISPKESLEDLAISRLAHNTANAEPDGKAYKSPRSPSKSLASPRSPSKSPSTDPDEKTATHPWSPKKTHVAASYPISPDSLISESKALSFKYPLSPVSPTSEFSESTRSSKYQISPSLEHTRSPKYPMSPVSPRSETSKTLKSPTSPKSRNLDSPTAEEKNFLSPTSNSLDSSKSPNKIFNPFPVTIHSRQNKEVAVRLGLYKK